MLLEKKKTAATAQRRSVRERVDLAASRIVRVNITSSF